MLVVRPVSELPVRIVAPAADAASLEERAGVRVAGRDRDDVPERPGPGRVQDGHRSGSVLLRPVPELPAVVGAPAAELPRREEGAHILGASCDPRDAAQRSGPGAVADE